MWDDMEVVSPRSSRSSRAARESMATWAKAADRYCESSTGSFITLEQDSDEDRLVDFTLPVTPFDRPHCDCAVAGPLLRSSQTMKVQGRTHSPLYQAIMRASPQRHKPK